MNVNTGLHVSDSEVLKKLINCENCAQHLINDHLHDYD